MVTKYATGDKVLIPATITMAEIKNGEIRYSTEEFERIVSAELDRGGKIFIAESKIIGYAKSDGKKAAGGQKRESWWQKWRNRQKKTVLDSRSLFNRLSCRTGNHAGKKR